ncbi:hypothetical protein [Scytonema sp. NUACC21]
MSQLDLSLYQTTLQFGISSIQELDYSEWEKIKTIWKRALANGLGSRVSAGYGHFQNVEVSDRTNQLLQIKLKGQGATSLLINKRMYPHFVTNDKGEKVRGEGYVELLTIFPDKSSETEKFLSFLKDDSQFTKIW